MRIDFEWKKPLPQIAKEKINSDVILFTANECRRHMTKYVPAQNLVLSQDVSIYEENGIGIVEYRSPYAHYQWEGELYVSSVTGSSFAVHGEYKVPTGIPLEQHGFKHPLATSHWDKAMWAADGQKVVNAVQRFIDRGSK